MTTLERALGLFLLLRGLISFPADLWFLWRRHRAKAPAHQPKAPTLANRVITEDIPKFMAVSPPFELIEGELEHVLSLPQVGLTYHLLFTLGVQNGAPTFLWRAHEPVQDYQVYVALDDWVQRHGEAIKAVLQLQAHNRQTHLSQEHDG